MTVRIDHRGALLGLLLVLAPGTARADGPSIPHSRHELDNGLTVLLHQDNRLPQVVVNLWFAVGSADEIPGRSGFAHLFEHLMFMGTERVPEGQFDVRMETIGGWNNAFTSNDVTVYYDVGPSEALELLLWMEADRLEALPNAMTQAKLDLQRGVVRNERRESEDSPFGELFMLAPELMFPEGHPYAHPVIGSHEDLEAAEVSDVTDFFNRWYRPDNAVLVIAGDFEESEALEMVGRTLGRVRRTGGELTRYEPGAPVEAPVRFHQATDQVSQSRLFMAWHTPAAYQEGDAALDLVAAILAQGRSSRLYSEVVYNERLAVDVDAGQYSQRLGSEFWVDASPEEGTSLEQLREALQSRIDRLANEGPTEEELARVRAAQAMRFVSGLEDLQARAMALGRYQTTLGESDYLARDLARYEDVDADDIKAAAAMLSADRVTVMEVRPEEAAEGGQE